MPKVQQNHYDPEILQTSYKSQYIKPNNPLTSTTLKSYNDSAIVSSYLNQKPKIPFYSDTSYKDSYKINPIVVEKQPKYEYKPKNAKFEGESSYKSDFKKINNQSDLISAGESIVNVKDYMNRKPKIPFEGSSSYK
jgi:hypothetical protein